MLLYKTSGCFCIEHGDVLYDNIRMFMDMITEGEFCNH